MFWWEREQVLMRTILSVLVLLYFAPVISSLESLNCDYTDLGFFFNKFNLVLVLHSHILAGFFNYLPKIKYILFRMKKHSKNHDYYCMQSAEYILTMFALNEQKKENFEEDFMKNKKERREIGKKAKN